MQQLRFDREEIVWQEVPGEVSLAFLCSGCPLRCQGCHSSGSWKAGRGAVLSEDYLRSRLQQYRGLISCVLFMGGEWHCALLEGMLRIAREEGLHTCPLHRPRAQRAERFFAAAPHLSENRPLAARARRLERSGHQSTIQRLALRRQPQSFVSRRNPMIRLHPEQLNGKLRFMDDYIAATNAADGSKMDANANVTHKNIATMENELMKDFLVQVNRAQVSRKISALFGAEWAQEYIRQIEAHEIYVHDETSLKPYCVSVTLYPFLRDGLAKLGGESQAPKHLASFCGSFVNLAFAISAQFAGAVATVEFLTSFRLFRPPRLWRRLSKHHAHEVANHLQHVVYSINQPAAARGYQSVFWNISLYDAHYFEAMFGDFVFPDFTKPEWQSVARLQNYFLKWFNQERSKSVLTFPVVTAAMLTDNGECKDKQFADEMAQELAEGNSFFVYLSDNPDSLASCCRLRNQIDDRTFSYTLGAGGVATGSINVITLNMNRLEQDGRRLAEEVAKLHRYRYAYRKLMEEYQAAGMLPV